MTGSGGLWWAVAAVLLLSLAAMPLLAELFRDPVRRMRSPETRLSGARGRRTHFRWFEPGGGKVPVSGVSVPGTPVVVMIHGLSTASYVFEAMIPALTGAGLRVLTYDLWGRGLSDRPHGRQDRHFFNRQLLQLLDAEVPSRPVILLGYSLGGGIAAAFAAAYPERVSGLVLVAPAGFTDAPSRFSEFTRRVPLIGDWVNSLWGTRNLRARIGRGPASQVADLARRQWREAGSRGYQRGILSTRRYMLTGDLSPEHEGFGQDGLPVMAIWGETDRVVPPGCREEMALANPHAVQVMIPGAGHSMVHVRPKELTAEILPFLSAQFPDLESLSAQQQGRIG